MATATAPAPAGATARGNRVFLLVSLTLGHVVMHFFQQSFLIMLPEIKNSFDLTKTQAGTLQGIRSIFGGLVNFPAGFLTDMFRTRWAVILAVSMGWVGLAYLLLGVAPSFALAVPAVALVGASAAVWHPPALSAISQRWSDHRGTALSIHGVGGSTGDTIAPTLVGLLLLAFTWQRLTLLGVFPAMALAFVVWYALRNVQGQEVKKVTVKQYLHGAGNLLRNRVLMLLVLSGGVRAMGQGALTTFLPIYFREDLGFSTAKTGLFFSLVTLMGIVSQPVLGFVSDKYGRKVVLVPCLALLGLFSMGLVWSGSGIGLIINLILIGLFVYALGQVVLATAMDIAGREVGATTVGLVFGGNFVFNFFSPIVGGALADHFGTKAVFLYTGALVVASAAMMSTLPLRRAAERAAQAAH